MSNAIENARKALEETELAGSDVAKYHALKAAVDALRELLESIEYEYAQGFETDYYETWYVGKPFGHESNRPLDEGYTLIKRGFLPWERA